MPLDVTARGLYAITATPFLDDGRIDLASIDSLTDFYLECGATGLTVLGIMGEALKLDATESLTVVSSYVKRAKGLPVVVGVSAPGFAGMRALALGAMDAGAAGVMIAPPNTLRTDDQIVAYFANAAEAIGNDVPFVLQDYPLQLLVQFTPRVIAEIVRGHENCVMLKCEDWPGLEKISTLRKMQKAGELRPVSILCGNGGVFLDFELERGADGAMTGYAFPDMLAELVALSAKGERARAHDLFDAHLPLMRYEQPPNLGLAVRKHILRRRGVIKSDAQRAPAAKLSETGKAEVDFLLERLARSDPRAAL